MTTLEIKMLQRYRVDRQPGMTASGPEQLVILVLKAADSAELAVAISKIDAMVIAHQLQAAAADARDS
jgi:hypothetical protein